MTREQEQAILQRATRDLVLDHLTAEEPDINRMPDAKVAQLYDELMAVPSTAQIKEAAVAAAAAVDDADPLVQDVRKEAELDFLGRAAAHAYMDTVADGLKKLGAGLEGLKTEILGTTAEERLRRDREKREHELSLRPREVSLELGARGAGGTLDVEQALQQLGLRESTQRQELANQLRKLQLGDQYARREREKALYQQLHGERSMAGPVTHALAGGALGGMMGSVARAAPELAGAAKGLPMIRGGATAGLGLYLARKLLENKNPATRPVTRLERERYLPGSMTADVAP